MDDLHFGYCVGIFFGVIYGVIICKVDDYSRKRLEEREK